MNAQAWTRMQGILQETGKSGHLAWDCTQLLAFLRAGRGVGSVGSEDSMRSWGPGRRKSARQSPPRWASDALTLVPKRQALVCLSQ